MGLSDAVQWWEDWQLRILVLGSLLVQFFLFFSDTVRTVPILRRLRGLVWIAYIGGDALAIYALATLFSRHKQQTMDGVSTAALEVIWAPVLLIHLAGQPGISAYSLEDNELWRRHVITLVSQVTVALYVFCKWWSGEKRLLQTAVLLFVVGILKFRQKPWALWRASFDKILSASDVFRPIEEGFGSACWRLCTANICGILNNAMKINATKEGGGGEKEEPDLSVQSLFSLEEYIKQAKKYVQDAVVASDQATAQAANFPGYYILMVLDMPARYPDRLRFMRSFLKMDHQNAYHLLQAQLRGIFNDLYTKAVAANSILGCCLRLLLPLLTLASVVVFAKSHKDGYNESDVRVTYILLCVTVMQEFFLPFLGWALVCIPCFISWLLLHIDPWNGMVSQYSFMSFCVRKKQPTILMKLATFICLREYANKYWYIWQLPAAFQITGLVRQHVDDGWKEYIHDAATFQSFNQLRGQWAMRKHRRSLFSPDLSDAFAELLGLSFKANFEISLFIWHITTDMCFHHPNTTPQGRQGEATQCSRLISNYMIYLLFNHPEMLMPGTTPGLITKESNEIELILANTKAPLDKEESFAREIICHTQGITTSTAFTVFAGQLTNTLLTWLRDEEERWQLIQGVWVEMLCYSASRCRGYLHAKSVGEGGEFLSYVWLLWSYLGMETLGVRHHMPQPLQGEATSAAGGVSTSHSQGGAGAIPSIEISPA